jgi:hypothetical protein
VSWKDNFFDKVADMLRFIGYACIAIDAIILAAFSLWFTGKFIWFFTDWINRIIFVQKW